MSETPSAYEILEEIRSKIGDMTEVMTALDCAFSAIFFLAGNLKRQGLLDGSTSEVLEGTLQRLDEIYRTDMQRDTLALYRKAIS